MSDFQWNGDDADSVVLSWQPRTAVYRSKTGVVIRQESDGICDDHGDDQILLTPMGALAVAWKIIETAHDIGIPKPDRKVMAKPIDIGPVHPPAAQAGPLLEVMQREAAE